jgi:diguanylate cyclase (GGDEF)-like protein/PAS domain S-box-containing protein
MDEAFYKTILDNLYDGVYFCDRDRKITFWSKGAEKLTGYTREEMEGTICWQGLLKHVDQEGTNLCHGECPLARTIADGLPRQDEVFLHHKDGHRMPVLVKVTPISDETGRIEGAVEVFSDNSQRVAALQAVQDLRKEAFLDSLSGLPNRRYTESQLAVKFDEMRRFQWNLGLLYIDVDNFKKVNDTWGHDVGDTALKMVANTLLRNARSYDFIGRWGGDEFVAILSHIDAKQLYFIANRFRFLVEQSSLFVKRKPITVTASIGGTMASAGDDPDSLVKRADQLMYRSKARGRNRVTVD